MGRIVRTIMVIITSHVILGCEGCENQPPLFVNSKYEISGSDEGDYAIYSCDVGYQSLDQSDTVVKFCQNENWEGPDINCQLLECPEPSVPAFGNISYVGNYYYSMSNISYTCDRGLKMEGHSSYRLCQSDGTWSDAAPYCNGNICKNNDFFTDQYCYNINTKEKTWQESRESCSSYRANLAYIGDQESQSQIVKEINQKFGKDHNYWIGLYEVMQWYWAYSNLSISYNNWEIEPNNYDGSCGFIKNNTKWSSSDCAQKMGYICQFDNECPGFYGGEGDFIKYDIVEIDKEIYCFVFNPSANMEKNCSKDRCSFYYRENNSSGLVMTGRLAEIIDEITQTYIESLIMTNNHELGNCNYWIGAEQKNANPRLWKWTNGLELTYSSWGKSEPSNLGENCVNILKDYAYNWNDESCEKTSRYICEYDPVSKTEDFCGFPGGIPHGIIVTSSQSQYAIGENVTYSCKAGYALDGSDSIECTGKGKWRGNQPTCVAVKCSSTPRDVSFASYVLISNEYRGIVVYQCTSTFRMVGYGVSTCLSNATWSTPQFACQPTSTSISRTTLSMFTSIFEMTSKIDSTTIESFTGVDGITETVDKLTGVTLSTKVNDKSTGFTGITLSTKVSNKLTEFTGITSSTKVYDKLTVSETTADLLTLPTEFVTTDQHESQTPTLEISTELPISNVVSTKSYTTYYDWLKTYSLMTSLETVDKTSTMSATEITQHSSPEEPEEVTTDDYSSSVSLQTSKYVSSHKPLTDSTRTTQFGSNSSAVTDSTTDTFSTNLETTQEPLTKSTFANSEISSEPVTLTTDSSFIVTTLNTFQQTFGGISSQQPSMKSTNQASKIPSTIEQTENVSTKSLTESATQITKSISPSETSQNTVGEVFTQKLMTKSSTQTEKSSFSTTSAKLTTLGTLPRTLSHEPLSGFTWRTANIPSSKSPIKLKTDNWSITETNDIKTSYNGKTRSITHENVYSTNPDNEPSITLENMETTMKSGRGTDNTLIKVGFLIFGMVIILIFIIISIWLISAVNNSGNKVLPVTTDYDSISIIPVEVTSLEDTKLKTETNRTMNNESFTLETKGIWLKDYDTQFVNDPWRPIIEENL